MTAPLILGTNSIKDEGYNVANSLRFDRASGDYLSRTPSGAGNRKTFTFSTWLKGHNADTKGSAYFFQADINGSSNIDAIGVTASGFQVSVNSANSGALNTTQLFRDYSAWYHFVFAVDTTQSTASNRMKLYVNGSQITNFDTETYPSQNYDFTGYNTTEQHNISWRNSEVDGYMAEVCFIDGQQLDPTSFGEFDEDTGIWKPIDVSGLTFGTNGFYLDFENSGSLGADVSGNGNNFTVNNLTSIDQTTDTCTNNFATKNPLANTGMTYAEGNLEIGYSVAEANARSTFGVSSGKWYWETKLTTVSADGVLVGICNEDVTQETSRGSLTGVYGVQDVTGNSFAFFRNNGSSGVSSGFPVPSQGDIIQCALDLDNSKFYMGINGTFYNLSGSTADPSAQTNPTFSSLISSTWFSFIEYRGGSATSEINYGNPTFSISSGNSDGNGYGNFEYSVPSGYYALNSKNLAEYG